jgi:hypothetical protein
MNEGDNGRNSFVSYSKNVDFIYSSGSLFKVIPAKFKVLAKFLSNPIITIMTTKSTELEKEKKCTIEKSEKI